MIVIFQTADGLEVYQNIPARNSSQLLKRIRRAIVNQSVVVKEQNPTENERTREYELISFDPPTYREI